MVALLYLFWSNKISKKLVRCLKVGSDVWWVNDIAEQVCLVRCETSSSVVRFQMSYIAQRGILPWVLPELASSTASLA